MASIQRGESVALAVAIGTAFVVVGYPWWALCALFLVFDLSALGFLAGPRVGAMAYNATHNYLGPAALALVPLLATTTDGPAGAAGLVAGCWGFHVAVDRALGYGLRSTTNPSVTHLGAVGRRRADAGQGPE